MALDEEGRFWINVDGTDWYIVSRKDELDVGTHDKIVDLVAKDGRMPMGLAPHVIIAQELGEVTEPVIPSKVALLMGTGLAISQIVANTRVETKVGDRVYEHRLVTASDVGSWPAVFESEFNADAEDDEEETEPRTYLSVEPGNGRVTEAARNHLMKFVMGNVRNRLTEVAVAAGVETMKGMAADLKAEIDAVVGMLSNGD